MIFSINVYYKISLKKLAANFIAMEEKLNNLQQIIDDFDEKSINHQILSLKQRMDKIQNDIQNDEISGKQELKLWLKTVVKLPEYFDIFIENGFDDIQKLEIMTMNQLNSMIIKQNDKLILFHHITKKTYNH